MWKRLSNLQQRRADTVTLGVQGVIIDESSHVLLVRHGYRPGWHFPGGGVERGEDVEDALAREIREETGVIVCKAPRLYGVYANFQSYPGDHVALFVVETWRRDAIPKPNAEIAEQRFFSRDDLPETLVAGARRRLTEIFGGADQSEHW